MFFNNAAKRRFIIMEHNIFMENQKPISFEQYLQYDENSRSNLGETLPVLVYRMLEYSIK